MKQVQLKKQITICHFNAAKKIILKTIGRLLFKNLDIPPQLYCFVASVYTGARPFKTYLLWEAGQGWHEFRQYYNGETIITKLLI
ncbi:MAG: hypothetical protein CMF69_11640 [Magnetovibrio sp.]|nr:hypothetical protein [Magnetovibrio sp.]|tara:strand:- start:2338 stop:2592 length:255 start_codon:yes stop_codon:yes gene_type:complete